MVPELPFVRGVGWHWLSVKSDLVGSLPSLLANYDVKLYGSTFAHALLNFAPVVSGDCSLVNRSVLEIVIAIDEAIPIPNVKPFNGPENSFSVGAEVVKAVLHLFVSLHNVQPPSRGVAVGCRLVLDEPAPLHVVIFELLQPAH